MIRARNVAIGGRERRRAAGVAWVGLWFFLSSGPAAPSPGAATPCFEIQALDDDTGRGVPLVQFRTVNKISWWTDSNGIIALDEPGLMGLEVYFHVSSPGYASPPEDLFKNRGVRLIPTPGGKAVVRLKRLNLAERLYRITGQGIYRDSLLTGHPVPVRHPALDGQVMGQDTVIATPYHGKIYWFWGDTDRPSYPLGNFKVSGATSQWPGRGGLDPGIGVDLDYFVDESGFARAMCPLPEEGMHWIEGLLTVPDGRGGECLVARMANEKDLSQAYDWHLMVFNDKRGVFESVQRWDIHDPHESAHPFRARIDGADYYYLFPNFRVRADLTSLADLGRYEAFTCLAGDGKWRGPESKIDREAAGSIRYSWKAGGDRLTGGRLANLIRGGKLRREESWNLLLDFETGAPLTRGLECVAWNAFRRKWIAFFADRPGEAWFAEADTPVGPWGYGRRVVTHGDYNFYNLAHHPFFDQEGGRLVYFEGTYTTSFSNARSETPRYDYNQLMYRLALDDPRLVLPQPVYRVRGENGGTRLMAGNQIEVAGLWEQVEAVAFFAVPPAGKGAGLVPVYATGSGGSVLSLEPPTSISIPLFVGQQLDDRESDQTRAGATTETAAPTPDLPALELLREYRRPADDDRVYDTNPPKIPGFVAVGRPLCRVWRVPGAMLTLDWKARPVMTNIK